MYHVINVDNWGKHFGHQSCFIFFNIALNIKFNFGNSFGTYILLLLLLFLFFLISILSIYALQ
jgi:hypothetical protein